MNAKTVLLCVCFLFFGPCNNSTAQSIPGGIVFSKGKDAIFMNLSTKEKFNLTSDLSKAVVKPPFAVSENGKCLMWFQNSRFFARELPVGAWKTIQAGIYKATNIVKDPYSPNPKSFSMREDKKEDIVWQREIRNFSLSPDGIRFAFESPHQAIGWVLNDQGNLQSISPKYVKQPDSFTGIFYLSTLSNIYLPPDDDPFIPVFGNVIEHEKELGNDTRVYNSNAIKKSAGFLTFQKLQAWESGQKKAAFIYQIGEQWGPIEIQTLDSKTQSFHDYYCKLNFLKSQGVGENYKGKARELEIKTSFPSVEALAWQPNGSLSVFSQGNVFLIDSSQINTAFDKSSMMIIQNESDIETFNAVSVNNVLQPKLELVAKGIKGTCFNWVSNSCFIFLGSDNSVYSWNQGIIEKISDSIGEFSYCSVSPFEGIKNPDLFADNQNIYKDTNTLSVISGTNKVEGYPEFSVGTIQTRWALHTKNSVYIYILPTIDRKTFLEFALLEDEDNLDNINDPTLYEYLSSQKQENIKQKTITSKKNVIVGVDRIIILKYGNAYSAIKPTLVSDTRKAPPWQMTYEWKHWPNVIASKKAVAKKPEKKELWQTTAIPIGKDFFIEEMKFCWKDPKEEYYTKDNSKVKFLLAYTPPDESRKEFFGWANDWVNTIIINPSKYDFIEYTYKENVIQLHGCIFLQSFVHIIKIGNKYIAIKPLREKQKWIQYQWRYWPEINLPNLAMR